MIEVRDNEQIDWMYPEIYGDKDKPRNKLTIALYHVRAANDIEIEYNADKDGWEIFQTFGDRFTDQNELVRKSVAFIPAWPDDEMNLDSD